ncbi:MAG: hypothetical protein ACHQ51_05945, partial [Elusimicrobiota bacterium]
MRQMISVLLALIPALPAAAQVRVVPEISRVVVSAPTAVAPLSAGALIPSLSASAAVPTPLAAGASLSAPAFALPAPLPMLPASAVPAAAAFGAPALSAAPAANIPAARDGSGRREKNPVYHSLKDLAKLTSQTPDDGARTFDGAAELGGQTQTDPSGVRPSIPAGVRAVDVEPVRSVADVDRLVPNIGNSADMHDELRARLPSMIPFDLYVYRDERGGRFTGIDLSKRPENLEKMPELQAHEVATIKKIMAYTPDLQVLVREEGATPDLVVGGVVSEMKSVHHGDVDVQLSHANHQLVAHSRRHGLGLGAAVLDVFGAKEAEPARIEAGIAKVLQENREIGFDRVYVFSGDKARTYAPGADGAFHLSPEPAFARSSVPAAPSSAMNFVPNALQRAVLPDMAVVTREIQEPSRLLRARGVEATVTMYGSARIPSPEKAQAAYDALVAEFGRRPKSAEAKKRVAAAREALRMSKYYRIARELGGLIAKEGGGKVAVVTGGGPG